MIRSDDRRGFALPAALFVLVIMAMMVSGGFFVARQESRVGTSSQNSAEAFYVAERGLSEVMADFDEDFLALPQGSSASVSDSAGAASWSVDVTRMSQRMFFLDATGTLNEGGHLGGATRRMGLVAKLVSTSLNAPAAVTIRGGFTANGAPNKVDGDDRIPQGWDNLMCTEPLSDMTGVLTDDAGEIKTNGGGGGKGKGKKGGGGGGGCPQQITGSPCIEEDDDKVDATLSVIEDDETWEELVSYADHRVTSIGMQGPVVQDGMCVTSDPDNWGDPLNPGQPCGSYFPIIHIDGDVNMRGASVGQGILLVDGDFTMSGTPRFYGLILVKGEFSAANGTPDVRGAVLALEMDRLNGTPNLYYSGCAISRSMLLSSLTRMRPLEERSWIDLTNITE